jgi:hypothetical protein
VPTGQSLVITSIDVAEAAKSATDTVILANAAVPSGQFFVAPLGNWVETLLVPCAPGPTTTQFRFSPGLVFQAGQNVWMSYAAGCTSDTVNFGIVGAAASYTVSAPNTSHFEYPSGIVFQPGATPSVVAATSTSTAGFCFESTHVIMYGYLTPTSATRAPIAIVSALVMLTPAITSAVMDFFRAPCEQDATTLCRVIPCTLNMP